MNAELHTLRALCGLPALLWFAAAACAIAVLPNEPRGFQVLQNALVSAGVGTLALRMTRIVEASVWRLLPGGHRALFRATAIVVLALSVTLGAAFMSSAPDADRDVPLWPVLALFTSFSLLGLLLLIGVGRHISRFLVFGYVVVVFFLSLISMLSFSAVPWFWFNAAAAWAAIWLLASFAPPPLRLATNMGRWLSGRRVSVERLLEHLNPRFAGRGDTASRALRTRQSTSFLGLPVAGLVLVGWAAFIHFGFSRRSSNDDLRNVIGAGSWMLVAVMLVLAQRYAAPAQLLWLRWGNSRGQIFRLVERNVIVDTLILGGLAWLASLLFAVWRGLPIEPVQVPKMFATFIAVGFVPAYLGLIWSTLHQWWQRMCAIPFIALTLYSSVGYWLFALGIRREGTVSIDLLHLALLVLAVIGARVVAGWRWNTLDWTHFRSTLPT